MEADHQNISLAASVEMKSGMDESDGKSFGDLSGRVPGISENMHPSGRKRSREDKLDEKHSISLSQQRKFTAYLMASQEEERTVVARELHEELGQILAALRINVSLLALEYPDQALLVARTKEMDQLIESSLLTVQRISSDLRPVMLDLLGLSDAIEWYAQKFQNETGIRCRTVTCINDQKIDRVVSTALFRIFQDMLANIIGHSGSSSVNVSLAERKGYLTLLVHDDGQVGIDQNENKGQLSFGIEGMRHRAEEFGGNFRIFNFPKSGVILIARIPLASKEV